ncbi:MAG TPA: maleylpyruvate isomerase family mycothiol-dependent enzyme [Dermatophilaceae bacterium]|nr:maleylpyruvate isomerase family mycothiol-dependent enzyme [Dermatophilaceae bacterium]
MDSAHHLDALEVAVARMAHTVAEGDPQLPVPTCPGWSLGHLVEHLGCAHLWAAQSARTATRPDPYPQQVLNGRTPGQWYADSGRELVSTLLALDATAPAWSFARHDRTAGFWRRRQLHETTIHWIDALLALGQPVPDTPVGTSGDLPGDVCADGVDEIVTFFLPRGLARAGGAVIAQVVTGPVAVTCTDTSRTWTLTPTDTDVVVVREAAPADVTVSGRAVDLYLGLWNRISRAGLTVEGDAQVGATFLAAPLVP